MTDDEDLLVCAECSEPSEDLSDDGYCEGCEAEFRREARHLRQLRSDYYRGQL